MGLVKHRIIGVDGSEVRGGHVLASRLDAREFTSLLIYKMRWGCQVNASGTGSTCSMYAGIRLKFRGGEGVSELDESSIRATRSGRRPARGA